MKPARFLRVDLHLQYYSDATQSAPSCKISSLHGQEQESPDVSMSLVRQALGKAHSLAMCAAQSLKMEVLKQATSTA